MIEPVLDHVVDALRSFAIAVVVPLPFFLLLAIAVKRRRLLGDVMRALPECRLNLLMHFVDALLVAPILVALTIVMAGRTRLPIWLASASSNSPMISRACRRRAG